MAPPLGDHGHSSIVEHDGVIYTTFRRGDQDVLLAAEAATGETRWQQAYDAPLPERFVGQFGPGPHSTPLVAGDRVFSATSGILLQAFDRNSGEPLWQRDLMKEEEVTPMMRGYGPSPLAWGDLLILNGGGSGQGVIALRQDSGETVWKALDGGGSYSSPVLMTLDGVEQIVVTLGATRAGLEPASGELLWQIELPQTSETTMATQVQVGPHQIFTSSAYADGSRLYEVRRSDGEWSAEEKWYSRKMRIMHGSVAHVGDQIIGSSGDFGPTFLAGLDVETGELNFRQRGFAKANVMRVGDNVLILDEDGTLAVGRPSPEGVEILASSPVIDSVSWTAPALIGTTLLVRNREEMLALDLGASVSGAAPVVTTTDAGAAGAAFERSAGGMTLQVPAELLQAGEAYFVTPGEDAQLIVQSQTPLQRTVVVSDRVVGALVAPFDLDHPGALEQPILDGGLRIPVRSLMGASGLIRPMLFGPRGFDEDSHPEIVVRFKEASDVEVIDTGEPEHYELTLKAKLEVEANGKELELEAPVELGFIGGTMETMTRNVGDLATLRSSFELDLADIGIQVPPPLRTVLASTVSVDVYLGLSTVTPDKSLDPSISQQEYAEERRFLMLARDLGDDVGADAHFRQLMRASWEDADRLERLALMVITERGIERRNLGLALEAAERADQLQSGRDALLLNTLARIRYERGDVDDAVQTQERALELIDDQQPNARPAVEANLRRYQAAQ